jgi:hypothetical protein
VAGLERVELADVEAAGGLADRDREERSAREVRGVGAGQRRARRAHVPVVHRRAVEERQGGAGDERRDHLRHLDANALGTNRDRAVIRHRADVRSVGGHEERGALARLAAVRGAAVRLQGVGDGCLHVARVERVAGHDVVVEDDLGPGEGGKVRLVLRVAAGHEGDASVDDQPEDQEQRHQPAGEEDQDLAVVGLRDAGRALIGAAVPGRGMKMPSARHLSSPSSA